MEACFSPKNFQEYEDAFGGETCTSPHNREPLHKITDVRMANENFRKSKKVTDREIGFAGVASMLKHLIYLETNLDSYQVNIRRR
jgi:hypothetical protein